MEVKKALILDLDGTVRRSKTGKSFIGGPDDIELIPGIEKWIWRYREMGYLILGVTNQGGVAWGYKTLEQNEEEINATVRLFKTNPFHRIECCCHHEKGIIEPYNHRSLFRKPDIGMLCSHEINAFENGYIIDWDNSLFIGDRFEDEECAKKAGIPFRHIDDFLMQSHKFTIE